ncbi:MAG: nucleotide exchange factor GrpE [Euryarchaeota archaeon RBG_19FT_COMBO_56_21]|nr:MAG: nucleotide exchange factor GrpE [Euryarchaeota archaeon RBG_19FT_COMBO_56_21]
MRVADEQLNESAEPEEDEPMQKEPEDPLALRDKRIAELTNDLKRLQAEFENYKKRVERTGDERFKAANQKLIADLLPILDSFDKALENTKNPGDIEGLRRGLQGLHKQFLQTLQREGLKEIRTDGRFDPFLHEAMLREERDDVEDGKILEVYQKGYVLSQKTLRPARVKVAHQKAAAETPEEAEAQNHDTPDDDRLKDEDQE